MIDLNSLKHVARLARLTVSESEIVRYSQELSVILEHFGNLAEVNTEGVLPLVTPTDIEIVLREDLVQKAETTAQVLSNAPARTGNLFTVPPVV